MVAVLVGACGGDAPVESEGPEAIDTLRFTDIAAGARHTCALSVDGRAFCWGFDGDGQVAANRPPGGASIPLPVDTDLRFVSISAGAQHTCALDETSAVYCWGGGPWGRAGRPQLMVEASGMVELVSTWAHTCGVSEAGDVACWGLGDDGQLGRDAGVENAILPTRVPELAGMQSVATGAAFSCALDGAGDAWCWGLDDVGQIGAGSRDERCTREETADPFRCAVSPIRVEGSAPYVDLVAGLFHACGLLGDGSVECWGDDGVEQLGVDDQGPDRCDWTSGFATDRPCARTPVRVSGTVKLASLGRANLHTCGIAADGRGYCWGDDSFGQVGSRVSEEGAGPEAIWDGEYRWRSLSGGQSHTCGVTLDGAAYCWGDNLWGQLGSTTEHSVRPALVRHPG